MKKLTFFEVIVESIVICSCGNKRQIIILIDN